MSTNIIRSIEKELEFSKINCNVDDFLKIWIFLRENTLYRRIYGSYNFVHCGQWWKSTWGVCLHQFAKVFFIYQYKTIWYGSEISFNPLKSFLAPLNLLSVPPKSPDFQNVSSAQCMITFSKPQGQWNIMASTKTTFEPPQMPLPWLSD